MSFAFFPHLQECLRNIESIEIQIKILFRILKMYLG